MTPSQLPGYLGREIPEGLPLLFTSTVFSVSLSSSGEEDLCHRRAPTVNPVKNMVIRINYD